MSSQLRAVLPFCLNNADFKAESHKSGLVQEENAEGLHLIDFEQLKIENQSLAEKIEERNDELARLRGKTSQVMQILAHIKEKLHNITNDNKLLQVCELRPLGIHTHPQSCHDLSVCSRTWSFVAMIWACLWSLPESLHLLDSVPRDSIDMPQCWP